MAIYPAFHGTLVLNDQAQETWLTYTDSSGSQQTDLMAREPPPPGSGPNGGVSAMWARFHNDPNTPNGANITVYGYVVETPGLQRLLHVTQS
jgi:hypothetical protein